MRICYLQHGPFEKPGIITQWAASNNHQLTEVHFYKQMFLPQINDFDLLIISGGTQNLLHMNQWPYLKDEISFIQQTEKAKKGILGICLGAQLLAESLGAKTEESPHPEIGVYPIELLAKALEDPVFSTFPQTFPVLHMHYQMFGLPVGAELLARSKGCPRQVFRLGDRIYGLQFHLEVTKSDMKARIDHEGKDFVPASYVNSLSELYLYDPCNINEKMIVLLNYFASNLMTATTIHTLTPPFRA